MLHGGAGGDGRIEQADVALPHQLARCRIDRVDGGSLVADEQHRPLADAAEGRRGAQRPVRAVGPADAAAGAVEGEQPPGERRQEDRVRAHRRLRAHGCHVGRPERPLQRQLADVAGVDRRVALPAAVGGIETPAVDGRQGACGAFAERIRRHRGFLVLGQMVGQRQRLAPSHVADVLRHLPARERMAYAYLAHAPDGVHVRRLGVRRRVVADGAPLGVVFRRRRRPSVHAHRASGQAEGDCAERRQGRRTNHQRCAQPPANGNAWPAKKPLSSLARNSAKSASSRAVPSRPAGTWRFKERTKESFCMSSGG